MKPDAIRSVWTPGLFILFFSSLFHSPLFLLSSSQARAADELTFVVLGDTRPGRDLKQPAVFLQIIEKINETAPRAVFHTGDIIYGKTDEGSGIEQQYKDYFRVSGRLKSEIHITPGNHDIWDERSARVFREKFGYLYRSVTIGSNHFILLNSTLPGKNGSLSGEQRLWLEKELEKSAGRGRNIFVFLHHPMYPVDGYVGKCMDRYPEERDSLHELFRRYGVRYVFSGHEHLYNLMEKDGVSYVISGGGGASLYAEEEKGGFHHFLLFTVRGKEIRFEVRRMEKTAGK